MVSAWKGVNKAKKDILLSCAKSIRESWLVGYEEAESQGLLQQKYRVVTEREASWKSRGRCAGYQLHLEGWRGV
jgi:hypothetical protein